MKLDHLGIMVADLARSRDYYERRLGMRVIEEGGDEGFRMLTLDAGEHEVHLFASRGEPAVPRFDHVAYRVTRGELAREMAALAASGEAFSGPHCYQDTAFIKFRDPDGLTFELIAPAAGPEALALARRYLALHNAARASGDVRELAALFAEDAALVFDRGALAFAGREQIARAFRESPPTDDLVELALAAMPCGARITYAWQSSPQSPAGELDLAVEGDCIQRLDVTRR